MRLFRALGSVSAVAAAAAVLAACSGGTAGAAATVGDTVITETQVQADTAEVVAIAQAVGTQVNTASVAREQVRRLVTAELVSVQADRKGISVTQGEIDAAIDQVAATTPGGRDALVQQLAAQNGVPPSAFNSFVETFLLQQKLIVETGIASQQEAQQQVLKDLAALSDELGVEVSPRYGAWDASQLRVGAPPLDLSSPAPVTGGTQPPAGQPAS